MDAARTESLTRAAIADTLRRMNLDDISTSTDETGRITIRGYLPRVAEAAVTLDPATDHVEASISTPQDAVHPLHPQAAQICQPAVDLTREFHTVFAEEMASRGLSLGRVSTVKPPTRGGVAASRGAARAQPTARRRTATS
jgi:hypothetical protein